MGHGTGVHNAVFVTNVLRGVTIGVLGASSLHIAQSCGVPQNYFIAARGVGLTLGPLIFARPIWRVVWSGNSQLFMALSLAVMALCELAIPRIVTGALLYPTFFIMGLAMATIDISCDVVLTTVHKEKCSVPLNIINAVYGLGGMLAPHLVVNAPNHVWDLLVLANVALATTLAGRRLQLGKPKGWKLKIRGTSPELKARPDPEEGLEDALPPPLEQENPPLRVLYVGFAFIFLAQATETAMSAWGFTFAVTVLGQPPSVAALFPSTFYLFYTFARIVVVLASTLLPPSAFVQAGAWCTLLGAALLQAAVRAFQAGGIYDGSEANVYFWLVCIAMIGIGTCPQFAMTLAAIRQHGSLQASHLGWYRTFSNLGNTTGMWLPGLVSLPNAELAWAIVGFCIMSAFVRDFPWRRQIAGKKVGHAPQK